MHKPGLFLDELEFESKCATIVFPRRTP